MARGVKRKSRPFQWSGPVSVLASIPPNGSVFGRSSKRGPNDGARALRGTAMGEPLLAEDIGRPAMVEKVAAGVRQAMKDAGISNPKDVHYVQTKTPLLTIDSVQDA